jgi:ATP-dependent DNA helicase 2 subunit 2
MESNNSTVPAKVKGKRNREAITPLSNLDVDALLGPERRRKISKDNAVAEFKQMLAAQVPDDINTVREAAEQMGEITRNLMKQLKDVTTGGERIFERATENMKIMREEMLEYEDPESYNNFIRCLKKDFMNGRFGDNRREMWWDIKKASLGLIDNELDPKSEVSVAEAAEVCDIYSPVTKIDADWITHSS